MVHLVASLAGPMIVYINKMYGRGERGEEMEREKRGERGGRGEREERGEGRGERVERGKGKGERGTESGEGKGERGENEAGTERQGGAVYLDGTWTARVLAAFHDDGDDDEALGEQD